MSRPAPLWNAARALMASAGRPIIVDELLEAIGCESNDLRPVMKRWAALGLIIEGPRVPRVRPFGPKTLKTFTLTEKGRAYRADQVPAKVPSLAPRTLDLVCLSRATESASLSKVKKSPKPPVSEPWQKMAQTTWANAAARRMNQAKAKPAKEGEAVIPAGVKVTVCPSCEDTRFKADPGHVGPFSMVGIGRDVETGRAWR